MRDASSVAEKDLEIAREFVSRLAEQCDPGQFRITLFGSRARGEADEESDLDLFIALQQEDPGGRLKKIARGIACDLTLENGILVSVFIANKQFLREHQGFSFLKTVEEEGVPL